MPGMEVSYKLTGTFFQSCKGIFLACLKLTECALKKLAVLSLFADGKTPTGFCKS